MDIKDSEHRRSSSISSSNNSRKSNTSDGGMRRPQGVAAMDITSFMNGKRESDLEQEFVVPFVK